MAVISVRGTAQLETRPDQATLHIRARARATQPSQVVQELEDSVAAVCSALRDMGGVPVTPEQRVSLAWLRAGMSLQRLERWDQQTGENVPTGELEGSVTLQVVVRDLDLLDAVATVLAQHVEMDSVLWTVDSDNPLWSRVRQLAVEDAFARARDYARALDASLGPVDQIADAGLLSFQAEPFAASGLPLVTLETVMPIAPGFLLMKNGTTAFCPILSLVSRGVYVIEPVDGAVPPVSLDASGVTSVVGAEVPLRYSQAVSRRLVNSPSSGQSRRGYLPPCRRHLSCCSRRGPARTAAEHRRGE